MAIEMQVLDVDYIMLNDHPTIRIFGKTSDKKSITVFVEDFFPYFYVLTKEEKNEFFLKYLKENYKNLLVKVEQVEKFLPIGFSQTPTKLWKITIKNPSLVPQMRDDLKTKNFVEDVFEADILFRNRFMADNEITGMGWYEIKGVGAKTYTVKTDMSVTLKDIRPIEKNENAPLKYLSIDIETYSEEAGMPDSSKDPIIMVSLFFCPSYKDKNSMVLIAKRTKVNSEDTKTFNDEKELLEEFLKIVDEFDPDIIVGYNNTNFDLPYIEARLRVNNLPRALGRCNQKNMSITKLSSVTTVTVPGRVVVDVYALIKEAVNKFGLYKGLKRFSLGDVSQTILGETKVDVAHSEISKFWKDDGDNFVKLINYSRKDAELPFRMLMELNMLDKFFEISKVTGLILQDVLDGGEAARIEQLLLREFNKRGFIVPNKPDTQELNRRNEERINYGLKGGFVLAPEIGLHDKAIVYLDFKSMYPSIMISFNICPTTLLKDKHNQVESIITPFNTVFVHPKVRKGIVPEIVEYLIKTRDKIKKEMKNVKTEQEKRYLHAKQYAFKTVANAFYGYTGYLRARLYVLEIANTITATGRELIKKAKNIVETQTPYKVVYADTDSVMVKLDTDDVKEAFKIGNEIAQLINSNIGYGLEMKVEGVFKTMLILSKKRYAGWSFEENNGTFTDSIVTKGIETVRRDWCNLVSETLQETLEIILKENDVKKALSLVKEKINNIKKGKVDISKLVITKSISRSLKTYKGIQPHVELLKKMRRRDPSSAPGIGDRIGYVIIKGTGQVSKRAEDPEYVVKNKIPIDSDYYIENQILPPLERVFEALAITKSEILGAGKQSGLSEIIVNGSKDEYLEYLEERDGFVCVSCGNILQRVPISGRCDSCKGELVFYKGDKRSRILLVS
ncbi:MAG: DNA-directed DNA polymerase [Candidatus Aenigmarchaeota archaeon]|nr:DNA-directed DNA polymerase [Candidatus Aenigmarchaeota archaeon]